MQKNLALLFWILPLVAIAEPPKLTSPEITTNGVTFRYFDADAFSVSVTGDFNQWSINSHLLERDKTGVWSITAPLKPGKHQYQFNVNGIRWKPDPNNPNKITDSYGSLKSVVEVPAAESAVSTPAAPLGSKETRFTYVDPLAKQVAVGGFFNQWSRTAHPMTNDNQGAWTTVVLLKPGKHAYKFWVDGKWIVDPANPTVVADGRGGSNSVVTVQQQENPKSEIRNKSE